MGLFSAIGDAISSVVKGVVNVISSVVRAVVDVVSSVVNFVLQPFMGLLGGMGGMPDAAQEAQRQDGVLVQRTGSNVAIPVIYGLRKTGSTVTYAETGSDNNQYLWVAHVLCEGPIEGLYEVFINDYQLDNSIITRLNASPGAIVDIPDGKFGGRCQLQFFPGEYYADPKLSSTVGTTSILKAAPSWKPEMVYNGLAVIFARYYWKKIETQADADNNPYSGSIPELKATVLGKKIASLIISAPQTYAYADAPVRYSTNPAECLLDYLRNPRYGKGLVNADIDWDTWRNSASKCNAEVTYVTGIKGPIMTCNYALDPGQTLFANTKTMLMGFRAYMPYIQGKYKLRIEDAGHPTDILSGEATIVATFNQDNIQGSVTFTGIDKSAKYNQVSVTYVDPDNKYTTQQVVYPETEADRQVYIALDGNRENKQEVTFPTITNYAMAKDMARLLFNKSRRQETCSLTVTSQGFELEPGDNIRIQSNILNFGTDPWRVISVKINDDMTVNLGCVRNPDDIYPYVRANEEDIVLPVYVPKGAGIYYPSSSNRPPIGLVPPSRVPLTGTDPNTSAGGGVGAANGTINSTPLIDPPIVIAPPLGDYINISRVTYRRDAVNIVYATLEFTQPYNAMYEATDVWYKGQGDIGYKKIIITDKPGAGNKVTYVLGPLLARSYALYTRVRYSTGEVSTKVGNALLGAEFLTQEDPQDTVTTVSNGWALPPFVYVPARNNLPQYVLASRPGSSTPPARSLVLKVRQNTATTTAEQPNYDINGIKVYWKLSSGAYWYEKKYLFPVGYLPGDEVTINFNEDLAETGDPELYDFIVRFTYTDNTESTKQWHYTNAPVQTGNSYNVFIDCKPAFVSEDSGAYTIDKVADHPEAVANPLNITVGIDYVFGQYLSAGNATVRFGVRPPNASNLQYWRGVRVYTRNIESNYFPQAANNGWIITETANITTDYDGLVTITAEIINNAKCEYLLVPLVRSGTSSVETTNGWYFKGNVNYTNSIAGQANYVSIVYSQRPNFKDLLSPILQNVQTTLNSNRPVALQSNPTIDVKNWELINRLSTNGAWSGGTLAENRLGVFYKLTFSIANVGSTCQDIVIYRRQNYPNSANSNVLGHWEKVVYTTGTNSSDISIYIRPPISRAEYFIAAGVADGTAYSLLPSGKKFIENPSFYDEFIVTVRQTGSVESNVGVFLHGMSRLSSKPQFAATYSIISPYPAKTVTLADYNVTTLETYKRLSSAYSVYSTSDLIATKQVSDADSVNKPFDSTAQTPIGISYVSGYTVY